MSAFVVIVYVAVAVNFIFGMSFQVVRIWVDDRSLRFKATMVLGSLVSAFIGCLVAAVIAWQHRAEWILVALFAAMFVAGGISGVISSIRR
ncbi:hypothetical protein ACFYO1_34050 [Nocardia sp. NPDC006044]|uniref:hypothetical protein n=1 Tax=Nocardia sp. NPDC006044 TaxID=3364306 RepID=UPI0036CC08DF